MWNWDTAKVLVGAFSVIVKSLRTIVWSSTRHLAPRLTPRWSIIAAAIYGGRHTPQPTLVTNNSYTQSLCRETLSPHSPSRSHTSNRPIYTIVSIVRWTTNNFTSNTMQCGWSSMTKEIKEAHGFLFSINFTFYTTTTSPSFCPGMASMASQVDTAPTKHRQIQIYLKNI